jgi:WD40 repeat protein
VRVWDVSTGVELNELKGYTSSVRPVAFSSDGMQIVSGSEDQSVQVWDASTSVELNELKGHTRSVTLVTKSLVWNLADNNWIISLPWKDHLMWVPQAAQVIQPSNILIISHHGFGFVDFQQSMIGGKWVCCYTPFFNV